MYCSAYWYLVEKTFSLPYLFHIMGLQCNADSTLTFHFVLGNDLPFLRQDISALICTFSSVKRNMFLYGCALVPDVIRYNHLVFR